MNFLDQKVWTGKIFATSWRDADGGVISVLEPATGDELAVVGMANASDVGRSVTQAADAQRSWAGSSTAPPCSPMPDPEYPPTTSNRSARLPQ